MINQHHPDQYYLVFCSHSKCGSLILLKDLFKILSLYVQVHLDLDAVVCCF